MNPTLFRSALCFFLLTLAGFAEPLGTLVREFDYDVVRFVRDPVRARIYATTKANTVIVINTQTVQVTNEFAIGSNPSGLDVNADGSRLFVACGGSTTAGIGVIDLVTLQKLPSLPTPYAPADVAAGLEDRLYISPVGGGSYDNLRQISAVDGAVQATLGGGVFVYYGAQLVLTPDRKKLFMGNVGLSPGTLARFDVATATPVFEQAGSNLGGNGQSVIMSHTGDAVCYAVGGGNSGYDIRLIPIDNVDGAIGTFECGAYPTNGAFSPDDAFFYTAPNTQDKVLVFSRSTFVQTGSFTIPQDAKDLITDSRGRHIYTSGSVYTEVGKLRVYGTGRDSGGFTITHPATATVRRGDSLSVAVTSDRNGVTFSATGLPAGVSINPASGLISGIPTVAGNYTVELLVTDTASIEATGTITLNVLTPFTVTAGAGGSVTASYAGTTWRQIGAAYSFTATANSGSVFSGWTGSRTSTSATLSGTVASDMAFTANFSNVVDFTVAVSGHGTITPANLLGTTHPLPGQQIGLTAVPADGSRFVGWTGSVTSSLSVIVVTVTGDASITANFESTSSAPLTLSASGLGSVHGAPSGTTTHFFGESLSLTPVPGPGARFTGWTGAATTTQNPLTFQFQGQMALVANFDMLRSYAGTYRAVLAPSEDVIVDGMMDVTIGVNGAFSAKLRYAGAVFAFTGNAAALSGVTVRLPRVGNALPLTVGLRLARQDGVPSLLLQVDDGALRFTSVSRARPLFPPSGISALIGQYTFQIPPPDAGGFGYGYGTARITRTGALRLEGVLGDGAPFSSGTYITEGHDTVLHIPLYEDKGFIGGTVHFDESESGSDFSGALSWSRPVRPTAQRYISGFSRPVTLLGSRFIVPAAGANLLSVTDARLVFEGGDLPTLASINVRLGVRNTIAPVLPVGGGFKTRLVTATGNFRGSFNGGQTFSGIVFQKASIAIGQFPSPDRVGSVRLEPR